MTSSADVVVLGSGPAGLAAAYRAARAGRHVVVLEQALVPGGLAASFEVDGVRVDHGSHRLHPSCASPILDLLRRLLGEDLQHRPRRGRIHLAGRFVAFPPRALDLVRHLPPSMVAGLVRDAALAPLRRPRADTFAEQVRAGLGPTMARAFYDPYARKIWAVPPEELSGELARRRVGARTPGAVVRTMVGRRRRDRGTFYYPRRGFGQLVERLAEAATEAGAELRLGAAVDALELRDASVVARTADGRSIEAALAFSTVPLPVLVQLAGDRAPAAVRAAAHHLGFRALVLVYLTLARPRLSTYDAHYFPELDVAFSRVSEPKNYRDGAGCDPPDRTVLCAELPCSVGDPTWGMPPEDLGALVVDGLARVGLGRIDPMGVVVRRVPRAYPVYRVGFEAALATLDRWASGQPRLLTFGRQGLFAHDNTHHALAMGWAAADALTARGGVDHAGWEAARARFRSHVVED